MSEVWEKTESKLTASELVSVGSAPALQWSSEEERGKAGVKELPSW